MATARMVGRFKDARSLSDKAREKLRRMLRFRAQSVVAVDLGVSSTLIDKLASGGTTKAVTVERVERVLETQ